MCGFINKAGRKLSRHGFGLAALKVACKFLFGHIYALRNTLTESKIS
jgi:hypothetical protein